MATADFHIENHGTIWLFEPLSEAARMFVEEEVQAEPWQLCGNCLCVDWRPALELREILIDAGFSVV